MTQRALVTELLREYGDRRLTVAKDIVQLPQRAALLRWEGAVEQGRIRRRALRGAFERTIQAVDASVLSWYGIRRPIWQETILRGHPWGMARDHDEEG